MCGGCRRAAPFEVSFGLTTSAWWPSANYLVLTESDFHESDQHYRRAPVRTIGARREDSAVWNLRPAFVWAGCIWRGGTVVDLCSGSWSGGIICVVGLEAGIRRAEKNSLESPV